MTVCKFFVQGNCRNGQFCRFQHPNHVNPNNYGMFVVGGFILLLIVKTCHLFHDTWTLKIIIWQFLSLNSICNTFIYCYFRSRSKQKQSLHGRKQRHYVSIIILQNDLNYCCATNLFKIIYIDFLLSFSFSALLWVTRLNLLKKEGNGHFLVMGLSRSDRASLGQRTFHQKKLDGKCTKPKRLETSSK